MASKKMNAEQRLWQAESDADMMARYEEIMASSSRRTAAINAAKKRAADLTSRAETMSRVAGVTRNRNSKRK